MQNLPHATLLLCAALLLAPPFLPDAAAQNKAASKPKSDAKKWSFSLLPTAMQRNPLLDFTIVTEMTDEGRKLPPPNFDKPVYYIMTSAGHHTEGQGLGNVPPMQIEQLKDKLIAALASNGYRPADENNPASQILRLVWGEHNTIDANTMETTQTDSETGETQEVGPPSIGLGEGYAITIDNYKNILSRAKIVGGNSFAREMETAMVEQAQSPARGGNMGPFTRFLNRNDTTATLVSQVFDSCYYIIVQSFDAAAFAKTRERILLWQTNMTTPAQGVSLEQTMPGLLENGAYFLGRETKVPEIVTKRPVKEGRVEIGEAEAVEYIITPSASGTGATQQPTPKAK